jgi:hypothetical protein
LGFTKDNDFAFRHQVRNTIVRATANQLLSPQYLPGLAPSTFWASQFPSRKGGFHSLDAGEALIAACNAKGPFNPINVRGRGIWREGHRIVVNLVAQFQMMLATPINASSRSTSEIKQIFDAARLHELLNLFPWRHPQDAMLLFGWLAIAPICGVLNWRPHCFVYGPPASGKSTIHSLAGRILNPLVVSAEGPSSEAGIRQTLGPDSRPVILDEFESDHQGAGLRSVLRLARSSSSADNPVLRGTPEGRAMQFSLRATFFFCAVNPGRMSAADQARILLLELVKHKGDRDVAKKIATGEAHFRELGPSWCGYMVLLAHILGPAIERFEAEMPSSDRRHRQNIATLLAGAFVALHGREPEIEEAKAWATEYTPAVDRLAEDIERDNSLECLQHLLAHVVEHFPLWHWIGVVAQGAADGRQAENADRITRIYDIVVKSSGDHKGVLIRHGSPNVAAVFRNTMWEGRGWERALHGLQGAFSVRHPVYFPGSTEKSRCVGIPLELIPEPIEPTETENGMKEY